MRRAVLFVALVAASGCRYQSNVGQAVCALVDESGTYADQKVDVLRMVKLGVVLRMVPGDELLLGRIDSRSYEKDNIAATLRLDARPVRAMAEKRAFAARVDDYGDSAKPSRFTDVSGALLLCADYLRDTQAGSRVIVVFSDLEEDLPRGVKRNLAATSLSGLHVAAINVKRLRHDNAEPVAFRARLDDWRRRVIDAGATDWQVIEAPERLVAYLDGAR